MTPEEFLCCFELRRKGGHSNNLDRPKGKKRTRSNNNDDENRPDYDDDIADYLHHRGDEAIGDKEAKDNIIIEDDYVGDDDDCSQFHDAKYEVSLVKNLSESKANILGGYLDDDECGDGDDVCCHDDMNSSSIIIIINSKSFITFTFVINHIINGNKVIAITRKPPNYHIVIIISNR